LKGPINEARKADIVNAYLLAYFEQALQGKSSDLFIDESTDYPEVIHLPPSG
jgi:hypothetical protein